MPANVQLILANVQSIVRHSFAKKVEAVPSKKVEAKGGNKQAHPCMHGTPLGLFGGKLEGGRKHTHTERKIQTERETHTDTHSNTH